MKHYRIIIAVVAFIVTIVVAVLVSEDAALPTQQADHPAENGQGIRINP